MPSESIVPTFPNPEAAEEAIRNKQAFKPSPLYPRDGTPALADLEVRLAALTRMEAGETLAFGSGMQAVCEAVELANLSRGDTSVFADGLYSQSVNYQEVLRERGVTIVNPSIQDTGQFAEAVKKHKPQLVYAETVANTPDAHVLDVERLLNMPLAEGWDPIIILDPTLATPTQRPLSSLLANATDKRVVLVESGTKNYVLNTDLLGMVHTKRKDLRQKLLQRRRTRGTTPGVASLAHAMAILPSQEEFEERNSAILANNKLFAETLYHGLRQGSPFLVAYPNLPNHPNHDYASEHYPDGASQCIFVTDQREGQTSGFPLVKALWEVDERADILSQSFGFDDLRLWRVESAVAARISCGAKDADSQMSMAERWAKKLNQL